MKPIHVLRNGPRSETRGLSGSRFKTLAEKIGVAVGTGSCRIDPLPRSFPEVVIAIVTDPRTRGAKKASNLHEGTPRSKSLDDSPSACRERTRFEIKDSLKKAEARSSRRCDRQRPLRKDLLVAPIHIVAEMTSKAARDAISPKQGAGVIDEARTVGDLDLLASYATTVMMRIGNHLELSAARWTMCAADTNFDPELASRFRSTCD